MARIKRKVKRNLLLLVLIIVIISAGLLGYKTFFNTGDNTPNNPIIDKPKEDPIKVYKASLIATGDGLLHSPIYNAAYNNGTYDFMKMLTYTKDKIKDYDIKYYNQETVFDSTSALQTYPRFNTPSAFGQNMIDIGFNMVSLATNHSMDMGANGAKVSAAWWEGQDKVLTHGMASSSE